MLISFTGNPSKLSEKELEDLGITKKLPTSIEQAIEAAEHDTELDQALTPGVLQHYLAMKKAEQEMLNAMNDKERRVWLMEHY